MEKSKGTLDFGTDADLVFLKPESLDVIATWIGGDCAYHNDALAEELILQETFILE
jgi:hypothetical protein